MGEGSRSTSIAATIIGSSPRAIHCIVSIDPENQRRFTIDGLTQGEARWIADTILRECQRWFR
jgi:hypothetical protein